MKKIEFSVNLLYKEEPQIISLSSNMIDQLLHLLRQCQDSKMRFLRLYEMIWAQVTILQITISIYLQIREIKLINYIQENKEIKHFHNCQDGRTQMKPTKILGSDKHKQVQVQVPITQIIARFLKQSRDLTIDSIDKKLVPL